MGVHINAHRLSKFCQRNRQNLLNPASQLVRHPCLTAGEAPPPNKLLENNDKKKSLSYDLGCSVLLGKSH